MGGPIFFYWRSNGKCTGIFAILVNVLIGVVARAAAASEHRVIRIRRSKGRRAPDRSIGIESALALRFNITLVQACDGLSLSAVRRFCERRHAERDRRNECGRSEFRQIAMHDLFSRSTRPDRLGV